MDSGPNELGSRGRSKQGGFCGQAQIVFREGANEVGNRFRSLERTKPREHAAEAAMLRQTEEQLEDTLPEIAAISTFWRHLPFAGCRFGPYSLHGLSKKTRAGAQIKGVAPDFAAAG
jgi:hypothetical protein